MSNIAFLGCGKMGSAMVSGVLNAKLYAADSIRVYDIDPGAQTWLRQQGLTPAAGSREAVQDCELAFLLVKPWQSEALIAEIRDCFPSKAVFVSIPLGLDLQSLGGMFGREDAKLARCMPNMPAQIGEGMSGICYGGNVTEEERLRVEAVLAVIGRYERVAEWQMAAVTAVSGSAPAYVFMLIEAMADAAVREGLPRDMALRFAAQAVKGSAAFVQATGEHPAALKDTICTPRGSTIEAVSALEEQGFRFAVMDAMRRCAEKAGGG